VKASAAVFELKLSTAAQHCARASKTMNADLQSTVDNLRKKTVQVLADSLSNSEVASPTERPLQDQPQQENSAASPAQPIQMVLIFDGINLISTPKLVFGNRFITVFRNRDLM
jgi:hypothetical protein